VSERATVPPLAQFLRQVSANLTAIRPHSPLLDLVMAAAEQQAAARERAQHGQMLTRQRENGCHFRQAASRNRRGLRSQPCRHNDQGEAEQEQRRGDDVQHEGNPA